MALPLIHSHLPWQVPYTQGVSLTVGSSVTIQGKPAVSSGGYVIYSPWVWRWRMSENTRVCVGTVTSRVSDVQACNQLQGHTQCRRRTAGRSRGPGEGSGLCLFTKGHRTSSRCRPRPLTAAQPEPWAKDQGIPPPWAG